MNIKKNSIFFVVITLSLISNLLSPFISLFNYTDEFVTVIALVGLILYCFLSRKKEKYIHIQFFLFILLSFISIISTLVSEDKNIVSAAFFDFFMSLKPIIIILGFYSLSNEKTAKYLGKKLRNFTLSLMILLLPIALYSEVVNNTWVSPLKRYGVYPFHFIFDFEADFGFFVISLMLILFFSDNKMTKKLTWVGFFIGSILVLLTTKIQVMVFVICFWVLYFFFKNKWKLNLFTVSILGMILFSFGSLQLNNYFLDENHYSPRKILLFDAFNIANSHFPIGSGLGTFGSEMASRWYSPIYIKLGYYNMYGLYGNNSALNDSFIAMVIAQFGWIGTIVYYLSFILLAIKSFKLNNYVSKAICYSIILTMFIASIGSGSIKSNCGIVVFALISIFLKEKEE